MKTLMQAALNMAQAYHTPVSYWLDLPMQEFAEWAEVAHQMAEESKTTQQRI